MAAEQSDTPDAAGRWLPVADAAPLLDTTERTLRRRVLAGQVRHRRRDGRTEVWVAGHAPVNSPVTDGAPDADGEPAPPSQPPQNAALSALERLLRDTLAEKDAAQQAAAMWQERARNLQAQVEELLALPAHEEGPRPWWRRLTGR